MVTKDVEGIEGVAEGAGHIFGKTALDQVSAQGLVLAMFRQAGFEEEAAELTYFFWCAYSHEHRMSYTTYSVKNILVHNLQLSLNFVYLSAFLKVFSFFPPKTTLRME
jgi:hypothetical protein